MSDRPLIPDAIKREVRQRCGFGCIFCGLPIYEYEHVSPWSEVREHRPDNLVLLCPNHHAEFTRGQRSKSEIEGAARNPHNLATGAVHHVFHVNRLPYEVLLATNVFEGVLNVLVIDNEPIIRVEKLLPGSGEFGLTASIYDRDHRQVLRIFQNEWVASSSEWDIEQQGPRLTIRSEKSNILLQIRAEPPSRIAFEKGSLFYKGFEVSFAEGAVFLHGKNAVTLSNVGFSGCRTALTLRTGGGNRPLGSEEGGGMVFSFSESAP
jgi:HNH endonuclease